METFFGTQFEVLAQTRKSKQAFGGRVRGSQHQRGDLFLFSVLMIWYLSPMAA